MLDQVTQSYINQYAVLGSLEDLCRLDAEARSLVAGPQPSVTFNVHGGPKSTLAFGSDGCHLQEGVTDGHIRLFLPSPQAFNRMIAGKGKPIPYRGFTSLGFLTGPFDRLTKRLEAVLRPQPAQLQDPEVRAVNTELTLHVAAAAVVQVAARDPELAQWSAAMPDGVIALEVAGGPALHLIKTRGVLNMQRGRAKAPRALMRFADVDTAHQVLSGQLDFFTAIASERLSLIGFIPMLDALDKLLHRAGLYLNQEQ